MAALSMSGISKHFGADVALNDISLDIQPGEFICLLGASGCGKTTLLRIIAGLEKPTTGTLTLEGKNLLDVPCHQRNVGMVFQSLALFSHLNVGDNVAYGLKLQGASVEQRNKRASELLETVGLSGMQSRPTSTLSGGQRQRVAIARALAIKPQLFLMDEPFSALDAGLRDRLQGEVKSLQRKLGITTIFVTHDQREAMALADRIVILHDGNIEQAASPTDIYRHPDSKFVAEFIGSNNLLELEIRSDTARFHSFNLGAQAAALAAADGPCTLSIRPEDISLNANTNAAKLTGRIVNQRLVGALMEREIEVDGHLIQQTSFQNDGSQTTVGDQVSLNWDWDRARVLSR